MGREVSLPSGAKATINFAPFPEAFKLAQACSKELEKLKLAGATSIFDVLKSVYFGAIASSEIEQLIWPCLRRCLYAGVKIDDSTFEEEDARQDFIPLCEEVIYEDALPFLKGPLSKLGIDFGAMGKLIQQ